LTVCWPSLPTDSRLKNTKRTNCCIYTVQFCWPCISIYLCNKNQLDAVFILIWLSVDRPANRQSTKKHITYQLLYICGTPPDDGLQIFPKHVQVDWRNKLRINSAPSGFYYTDNMYIFLKWQNIPVYYLFKTLITYSVADNLEWLSVAVEWFQTFRLRWVARIWTVLIKGLHLCTQLLQANAIVVTIPSFNILTNSFDAIVLSSPVCLYIGRPCYWISCQILTVGKYCLSADTEFLIQQESH